MHPVLARAANAFAEQVAATSLAEAQTSPDPKLNRWSGQQVVEHLILSLRSSREELLRGLRRRSSRSSRSTLLQHALGLQLFFGSMSRGLPALPRLTPGSLTPQDGATLSARLLAEAEELSKVLAECRLVFGLRPCGQHPIYGPLRVEEWRNYHAVHLRHHFKQFEESIAFARKNLEGDGLGKASGPKQEADHGIKDRTNGDRRR